MIESNEITKYVIPQRTLVEEDIDCEKEIFIDENYHCNSLSEKELYETDSYEITMRSYMSLMNIHRRNPNKLTCSYNCKAENLEMDTHLCTVRRAGIIPWKKLNNNTWFLFGLDSSSGDITDFGGTFEYKDKSLLNTAYREYSEESYNSAGINPDDVGKSLGILCRSTRSVDVFVKYNNSWEKMYDIFYKGRSKDNVFEVVDLFHISAKQLSILLSYEKNGDSGFLFYDKIWNLLKKNIGVIYKIIVKHGTNDKKNRNKGFVKTKRKRYKNPDKQRNNGFPWRKV